MRLRSMVLVFSMTLLAACASAQPGRLDIPGYAHLARIASDSNNLSLSGTVLHLATRLSHDSDARQLLANIDGIQVRNFEFAADGAYSDEDVESVRRQLVAPKWSRVLRTRDSRQHEAVDIYLCQENGEARGLAIIVAEPRELTIVNIVGKITLQQLSRLRGQFGMPRTLASD